MVWEGLLPDRRQIQKCASKPKLHDAKVPQNGGMTKKENIKKNSVRLSSTEFDYLKRNALLICSFAFGIHVCDSVIRDYQQ